MKALIELYQGDVETIKAKLDDMLVPSEVEEHNEMAQAWIEQGISPEIANYVARLSSLYSVLDISTVLQKRQISRASAKLYYNLGDRLSLHWFLKQINGRLLITIGRHWQERHSAKT